MLGSLYSTHTRMDLPHLSVPWLQGLVHSPGFLCRETTSRPPLRTQARNFHQGGRTCRQLWEPQPREAGVHFVRGVIVGTS